MFFEGMKDKINQYLYSWYLAECGHMTKLKGTINVYGDIRQIKLLVKDGKVKRCLKCSEKMGISCARCGKGILIGEYISYDTFGSYVVIPKKAVAYSKKMSQYITCSSCTGMHGFAIGRWVAPGRIKKMEDL